MNAIGYIRQSRRTDLEVALSYDGQLAAIQKLAGDPAVAILSDMGRSGGEGKKHLRAGYLELLRRIEAGSVSAVYALNLSRIARSVPELYAVMGLAREHKVKVVTAKEGAMDPTTATGKLTFGMFALLAEFVRDLAVESAMENVAERRARGDRMGRLPYGAKEGEDPAAVLAAFQERRTLNGAATLLMERKVPTSLGRGQWSRTSVRRVLDRYYPEALPESTAAGRRDRPPFVLFHLVRCHCGRFLTGSRQRHGATYSTAMRCYGGEIDPAHSRPASAPEGRLLDYVRAAVEAELERRHLPKEVETAPVEDVAELQAEREHVLFQHQRGWLTDTEAETAMVGITERAEALRAAETILEVGAIDWTWAPADLNRILAALIADFRVDAAMQPLPPVFRP